MTATCSARISGITCSIMRSFTPRHGCPFMPWGRCCSFSFAGPSSTICGSCSWNVRLSQDCSRSATAGRSSSGPVLLYRPSGAGNRDTGRKETGTACRCSSFAEICPLPMNYTDTRKSSAAFCFNAWDCGWTGHVVMPDRLFSVNMHIVCIYYSYMYVVYGIPDYNYADI